MADREDRTEAASGHQLQKARDEGRVPLSQELPVLAVLAAMTLLLAMAAPGILRSLVQGIVVFLAHADRINPVTGLRMAALMALRAAAPFVLAAMVAGTAAVLLQTGFLLKASALMPDLARLDPRQGLRRVFGLPVLIEAGKSVLKVGVVAWAGWHAASGMLPELMQAVQWDAGGVSAHLARQILHILISMLAAQAAIAGLDILRARIQHASGLRMSRQDLRDEQKEMDGDPRVKGRLRQLRMQRARKRMMAAVPKATVVLTNPTHYAVALAYERGAGGAPRVVAKGIDEVAMRIRELARKSGVTVIANPPLARALYVVPVDAEIPAEHYKMVAEIVAYVWRLRGKTVRSGGQPAGAG